MQGLTKSQHYCNFGKKPQLQKNMTMLEQFKRLTAKNVEDVLTHFDFKTKTFGTPSGMTVVTISVASKDSTHHMYLIKRGNDFPIKQIALAEQKQHLLIEDILGKCIIDTRLLKEDGKEEQLSEAHLVGGDAFAMKNHSLKCTLWIPTPRTILLMTVPFAGANINNSPLNEECVSFLMKGAMLEDYKVMLRSVFDSYQIKSNEPLIKQLANKAKESEL